ncbi:MAG: hypothetical protein QGG54_06145 [Gammaproteobacteria bacterium]|nr:hypothetical protein [Gammaproteobacteria bacterium]|tara:strand:+ start:75 stop:305 length:231 start_codon:yes stop_codon:yes gene_type:complete
MYGRISKTFTCLGLLVLFSSHTACSNQQLYEAIQQNGLQACEEIPIPQQEDCKAQYQTSYEEYRRESVRDSAAENP